MIFIDQQESNYEISDSITNFTMFFSSSEEGDQLGGDQSTIYSIRQDVVSLD